MLSFRRFAPVLAVSLAFLIPPGLATAATGPNAVVTEHYASHPLRVRPGVSSAPTGLSPSTIKSAYSFSTSDTVGTGKTIAIVDAYDDPDAESDLAVWRAATGVPPDDRRPTGKPQLGAAAARAQHAALFALERRARGGADRVA